MPQGSWMSSEEVRDGNESVEKEMGLVITKSTMAMVEMDNVLDLCETQPLQNMTYLLPKANLELGKRVEELEAGAESGKWAKLKEVNPHDCLMGEMFSNEEFPPLCKDSLRPLKNKEVRHSPEQRGAGSSTPSLQNGNSPPELQQNSRAGAPRDKKRVRAEAVYCGYH